MRNEILNLEGVKKVAIMGGTFDPIHYGHLVAANCVRQEFDIDKIIFMPTGNPPHKQNKIVSHSEHRYLMTVLATVNNPFFEVSRLEIDRMGLTYTIDTINQIKKLCNDYTKIYFITGADAIEQIFLWKDADKLINLCNFIGVSRPNYNFEKISNKLNENFKKKINFLEIPALSISSTDIKNKISNNKTISYLVPKEVEEYIIKSNLYKDLNFKTKYLNHIKILKQNLTNPRFEHSLEVAKTALALAKKYNANLEKAYIAGLLHDCAKCFTNEKKVELCKKYKIKLDVFFKNQLDLTHSFLGYHIAKDIYNIKDEDVLNAIKYHTTGCKNMSLLEKIVYIADYIEPTRKAYDATIKARELAFLDIDKTMIFILENTIQFNKQKQNNIHPLSIDALNFLKGENYEQSKTTLS